jgi:hypothetical protein
MYLGKIHIPQNYYLGDALHSATLGEKFEAIAFGDDRTAVSTLLATIVGPEAAHSENARIYQDEIFPIETFVKDENNESAIKTFPVLQALHAARRIVAPINVTGIFRPDPNELYLRIAEGEKSRTLLIEDTNDADTWDFVHTIYEELK